MKKNEKEEIEIKQNTNIEILQSTYEFNGFELESVRVENDRTFVTFKKVE